MLANGLGVWSVFEHIGPARKLIHRFKYHGMSEVARLYAPLMEALIPPQANGLVPIPRVKSRIIRYGFDPALVLANLMAEHCGLPVYTALSPAWWGRVHAGRQFSDRKPPRFGLRFQVPPKMVLVDDVVTTGLTLLTASSLLNTEPIAAITATCTPVLPHNANDKPPENSTEG